jgi:Cu(I)-responsive transcriptional regulator
MNIGEAARASGVSVRMIRHYEMLGLLPAPPRSASGYRHYGTAALVRLRFVRRARELGFSLAAIAELVSLWESPGRASAEVKAVAARHLADLDARIAALQTMRDALTAVAARCHGDARPECPILDTLAAVGELPPQGGTLKPVD